MRNASHEGGCGGGGGPGFPAPSAGTGTLETPVKNFADSQKANSQKSKNSFAGRAGELLVCFEFVSRGVEAVVNSFPSSKADILIDTGWRMLRCQVKSTHAPAVYVSRPAVQGRGTEQTRVFGCAKKRATKYSFKLKQGTVRYSEAGVDLYAFVALDTRTVLYMLPAELDNGNDRMSKRFGAQAFAKMAAGSLDRCLAALEPQ